LNQTAFYPTTTSSVADLPDAALEAAARAMPGAAMSFPNAPTVNILVICCNFE
jgi:hypothetical protein